MRTNGQTYRTEGETRAYIDECERLFESQLSRAIDAVLSRRSLSTVTLSGPSCSGKTTTARKLIGSVTAAGVRSHVVSIDDFYKNRSDAVMKRTESGELKPDYETVASIDLAAFSDFVDRLSAPGDEKTLFAPKFDFGSGRREGVRELTVRRGDIVIFEGIQAIYPEIVSLLPEDNISLHISVGEALSVGGNVFLPEDVRLIRRLVRDYNYRGAPPELTFYLWDDVRDNEIRNIEPYTAACDVTISSLLPYELGVIKPYLLDVLGTLPEGSVYAGLAGKIASSVKEILEIPLGFVPEGSVFREFLH